MNDKEEKLENINKLFVESVEDVNNKDDFTIQPKLERKPGPRLSTYNPHINTDLSWHKERHRSKAEELNSLRRQILRDRNKETKWQKLKKLPKNLMVYLNEKIKQYWSL